MNAIPVRDLVEKMLQKDPTNRIDALAALNHPWLHDGCDTSLAVSNCASKRNAIEGVRDNMRHDVLLSCCSTAEVELML